MKNIGQYARLAIWSAKVEERTVSLAGTKGIPAKIQNRTREKREGVVQLKKKTRVSREGGKTSSFACGRTNAMVWAGGVGAVHFLKQEKVGRTRKGVE